MVLFFPKLKQVKEDNKKIIENYTSERTLRKKYYNMVEDMKGVVRQLLMVSLVYSVAVSRLNVYLQVKSGCFVGFDL